MPTTRTVDALLQDIRLLGETQFALVQAVRALAARTIRPLTEEVKYGGILFSSGVGFAGVFAYRQHVSVEFGHGARIDDARGWLEGRGQGRRHLKLRQPADIQDRQLAEYLRLALEAARAAARQGSGA